MAEDIMRGEKEKIKGKLRNTKGKITGSPRDRLGGWMEEEKGKARKRVGRAKYKV